MAKRNEPTPLPSDAQWEVLNIIWDRGEATVGEVWQEFSARRSVARNTVLTLIARLEEKGWLRRRAEGERAPLQRHRSTADGAAANRPAAGRYGLSGFGRRAGHGAAGRRRPFRGGSASGFGRCWKRPAGRKKGGANHEPADEVLPGRCDRAVGGQRAGANCRGRGVGVVARVGLRTASPALCHGIWLCALLCVLLSPAVAYVADSGRAVARFAAVVARPASTDSSCRRPRAR